MVSYQKAEANSPTLSDMDFEALSLTHKIQQPDATHKTGAIRRPKLTRYLPPNKDEAFIGALLPSVEVSPFLASVYQTDNQETTQLIQRECPSLSQVPASDISFSIRFDDGEKTDGVLFRLTADAWPLAIHKTLPIVHVDAKSQKSASSQLSAPTKPANNESARSGGKPTLAVQAEAAQSDGMKDAKNSHVKTTFSALTWQDLVDQGALLGIHGGPNIGSDGWTDKADRMGGKEPLDYKEAWENLIREKALLGIHGGPNAHQRQLPVNGGLRALTSVQSWQDLAKWQASLEG